MNDKRVELLKKCLNIATALFTVMAGICFIVACLGIYNGGEGEYTRAAVAESFSKIAIPIYIWIALVILGGVLHFALPRGKEKRIPGKRNGINKGKSNPKLLLTVRLALVILGLTLVIAGACMGGMADVLAKAINICTECVGLG